MSHPPQPRRRAYPTQPSIEAQERAEAHRRLLEEFGVLDAERTRGESADSDDEQE